MALSIFIPGNCCPLIKLFKQSECSSLYSKFALWPSRSILFYEELAIGFIIHTSALTDTTKLPQTVYLKVLYNDETCTLAQIADSSLPDITSENKLSQTLEKLSAVVQKPITCQTDLDGSRVTVSIWQFEVPVGYPKQEVGGSISFHASLVNPHLHLPLNGENQPDPDIPVDLSMQPKLLENLLEGLNFHISQLPNKNFQFSPRMNNGTPGSSTPKINEIENLPAKIDEPGSENSIALSLPTSLPLILKLRSTKPGGRNDILLTTLSIEASSELLNFAAQKAYGDRFYINIISLEAVFRSGTIIQLGDISFPLRCSVDDVINITYKLINNDYLDSQMKNATGSAPSTSRVLQLNMKVQMLKHNAFSETFINASNVISTLWSPLLEFGHLAPPISNTLKTVANASHFQIQSQFNSLAPLVKHNGNLPKKSLMVNNVIGVNKSKVSLAPPRASSPIPGRQLPSAGSSPLLHSGRSAGFPSKKSYKSMLTLPSTTSAVTVNLSANTNSSLSGLLLTFKGNLSIELGRIITWKIQAINQSPRTLSLSVIVKNARKRNSIYLQGEASTGATLGSFSSSNIATTGPEDSGDASLQIFNKLQLYFHYNLLKLDRGGVVVLTNDVRLGPLEPNLVFETEIQLIGIKKGISNLDGLGVIDLASGDGIDFGKLVEVFVM